MGKQRLLKLELLPLSYDREMRNLTLFFKALYGYVDLDINNCVSFTQHGRTRLSQATGVMLQTPICRTAAFQSSYFNIGIGIGTSELEHRMSRCQYRYIFLNADI